MTRYAVLPLLLIPLCLLGACGEEESTTVPDGGACWVTRGAPAPDGDSYLIISSCASSDEASCEGDWRRGEACPPREEERVGPGATVDSCEECLSGECHLTYVDPCCSCSDCPRRCDDGADSFSRWGPRWHVCD